MIAVEEALTRNTDARDSSRTNDLESEHGVRGSVTRWIGERGKRMTYSHTPNDA